MSAMKKGTKLTENPKDYMLRVRMDSDTTKKLDYLSEKFKVSKSEIVRKGIEEQYQKITK